MITNAAGEVAVAYYQPSQVYVSGDWTATGREYVFVTQFKGVCMAWVDAADVPGLLATRGGCCDKRQQLFAYANQAQVDIWTHGGRGAAVEVSGCGC